MWRKIQATHLFSLKRRIYMCGFLGFFLHNTILPFRANKTDNLKLFLMSSNWFLKASSQTARKILKGRETVPGSESLKYVAKEIWTKRTLRCRFCRKGEEINGKGVFAISNVKKDPKEFYILWNEIMAVIKWKM